MTVVRRGDMKTEYAFAFPLNLTFSPGEKEPTSKSLTQQTIAERSAFTLSQSNVHTELL